jgi:group I intron endonuclease
MIIYKATNKVNGKVYIGKTKYTLDHRKSEHIRKAKNGKLLFHKALRKYGEVNFDWNVIYQCDNFEELNKAEIKFITEYNSNEVGYNLTTGGDGGYTFSDDVLKKIGEHTKLRNDKFGNPFEGKTHSDETKKILSEKAKIRYQTNEHPLKGVPRPDDVKDKISTKVNDWLKDNEPSMKGKVHTTKAKQAMREARIDWHTENENGFKGKTHTDEVKKRISEKAKGRPSPNKDKELSETHRENLSKAQSEWLKNNKHPNLGKTWTYDEVTCPKCGKIGKGPNMKRYHFENCKK